MVGRALGPSDLGRYSYYLWILAVASAVLAVGIPTAITRLAAEHLETARAGLGRAALGFACRLHGAVALMAAAVGGGLALTGRLSPPLAAMIVVGIAATVVSLDLEGFLTGLGRFRAMAACAALGAGAQVALAGTAVAVGASWEWFVAISVAGTAVALGLQALFVGRPAAAMPRISMAGERRRFLGFALVVTGATVVDAVIWGRPELAFLERFRGDSDVGLYSAALRLASLAALLPVVAAKPLLPQFSLLRGSGRVEELRALYPRVCAAMMALTVPLAAGGAATAHALVVGFYGPRFAAAATSAAILFGGALVNALVAPATAGVLTGPRPRLVAEVGLGGALVNLAMDAILIPPFGPVGAAAATVGTQSACVLFGIAYCWWRLGLRYPVSAAWRLLALGAVSAVAAGVVTRMVHGTPGLAAGIVVGGVLYLSPFAVSSTLRRMVLEA